MKYSMGTTGVGTNAERWVGRLKTCMQHVSCRHSQFVANRPSIRLIEPASGGRNTWGELLALHGTSIALVSSANPSTNLVGVWGKLVLLWFVGTSERLRSRTSALVATTLLLGAALVQTGCGGGNSTPALQSPPTINTGNGILPSQTAPNATQLASTAPKHVLTADYVGLTGTALPPSALGPWLSWAETSFQLNPTVRAAGIKAMLYTNPNRIFSGGAMWTKVESAFAHTCAGARIKDNSYGSYLMDPSSSTVRNDWQNYIESLSVSGVTWDAVFEDDGNDVLYVNGTPCNYAPDTWLASSVGLNSFQSPIPIIYNGLQINNEMGLNVSPNVLGGMEEACYSGLTYPKMWDSYWAASENIEIKMSYANKLFICYGRSMLDASSASGVDSRMYSYASFLLTYNRSKTALWEYYKTPSLFHVQPETELVAEHPLIKTPNTIDGLLLSTGVYGREYADCYVAGVRIGPCAAVVNPAGHTSHAYPYGTKYLHMLTLSGGGILDGGTLSTLGGRPPSTLPALGSVIVFK